MTTRGGGPTHGRVDASAIEPITRADGVLRSAKRRDDVNGIEVAQDQLCAAVRVAVYDGGVSWQSIGDALGARRGAVYQRFRRRPQRAEAGNGPPAVRPAR